MTMDHKFIDLWEMTMSREVLEILEKMDKKANGNYIGS